VRFGVLGPLAVWTAEGEAVRVPDRKVRALLADLLLHDGRPVPASRLIDDLWGDDLPVNPTSTLQTRVSQLRRALEDAEPGGRALVVTQAPGYAIKVDPDDLDVGRLRALVRRARASADARTRASLLADALAMWRGSPYADVAAEPFAVAAVAGLDEERMAVLEEHADARLELGEHDALVAPLAELVVRYPLRQRLRAAYMRALYRAGRHDEALDTYRDLRTRLADELGLDPSAELAALNRAVLNQDPALAGPAASGDGGSNLPAALTELIGRDEAVERIAGWLERHRLVTLTGAGGVGKTSLALETARQLSGTYRQGAWLVELTTVARPAGGNGGDPTDTSQVGSVAAAVAAVLDVPFDPAAGDRLGQLAAALRDRQLLLVLDNCEHVVDAAAAVADRLLREAPRMRVLATGREPLGLFGEQLWPVAPLELPEPGADAETAGRSSAVRLFAARAAAAEPGFRLGPDNVADVVEICRRLDGLPLALELAATRVRTLGVRDLAARLDDRFRVLAARRRGAPDRQQTLHAVIEWSWDLLTEQERAVLRRMAMHADSCTLQAAEAVCSAEEGAFDVAEVLGRLVDRSLVVRREGTSGSRYRQLETVRAFGLERLAEAGEYDGTRERYVRYYGELARRSEPRLYGHGDLFDHLGALYRSGSPPPRAGSRPGRRAVATVTSADGTPIAYERWGDGPPLVLVGGALNDRATFVPLAKRLAERFSAVTYDRRGRAESGDVPPYAVAREIEDLAAVVALLGGPAYAFAVSSGSVLVAEAVTAGVPIAGMALIEPPFILDDSRQPMPTDFAVRLEKLIAAGRRGDAVELFLTTAVEMPAEVVAPMRSAPLWADLEAMAHTIAYDLAVMGDFSLPPHWAEAITVPALIIDGAQSAVWRQTASQVVAEVLPRARRCTLAEYTNADPDVLAPILEDFFSR
jgi:predicted ATPase/DNA-binding SARP family transcriptional activator